MKITDLVTMDQVKLNMARATHTSLVSLLDMWTPEVAHSKPHGYLYEIKYFITRLPYTMKSVSYACSRRARMAYSNETAKDHFIGSYTVGEFAMDNPEEYLIGDGALEKFSMELYPYTFLTNTVTKDENRELSSLKGKKLTKDKYDAIGIELLIGGSVRKNPDLPEGFTEWENGKYFSTSIF
jgi:hypothetical protein